MHRDWDFSLESWFISSFQAVILMPNMAAEQQRIFAIGDARSMLIKQKLVRQHSSHVFPATGVGQLPPASREAHLGRSQAPPPSEKAVKGKTRVSDARLGHVWASVSVRRASPRGERSKCSSRCREAWGSIGGGVIRGQVLEQAPKNWLEFAEPRAASLPTERGGLTGLTLSVCAGQPGVLFFEGLTAEEALRQETHAKFSPALRYIE